MRVYRLPRVQIIRGNLDRRPIPDPSRFPGDLDGAACELRFDRPGLCRCPCGARGTGPSDVGHSDHQLFFLDLLQILLTVSLHPLID
jgi:hypothetical protein